MPNPFARLLIRAVLVVYGWQLVTITAAIAVCEGRTPSRCEVQWARAEGAASSIPATLLAWIADSPIVKP